MIAIAVVAAAVALAKQFADTMADDGKFERSMVLLAVTCDRCEAVIQTIDYCRSAVEIAAINLKSNSRPSQATIDAAPLIPISHPVFKRTQTETETETKLTHSLDFRLEITFDAKAMDQMILTLTNGTKI